MTSAKGPRAVSATATSNVVCCWFLALPPARTRLASCLPRLCVHPRRHITARHGETRQSTRETQIARHTRSSPPNDVATARMHRQTHVQPLELAQVRLLLRGPRSRRAAIPEERHASRVHAPFFLLRFRFDCVLRSPDSTRAQHGFSCAHYGAALGTIRSCVHYEESDVRDPRSPQY
jgi:hypothetical protein